MRVTMHDPASGEVAAFLQLLIRLRMGFDGETSSVALRSAAAAELPSRGEPLQKTLNKLNLLGDAEAACTAVRYLLDLRWLASEAPASEPEKRQLTLGPCFYLELLPQLKSTELPVCGVCKQAAILKLERCNSCGAQCHVSCVEELRAKVQRQTGSRLTCCSCNSAWEPA